MAENGTDGRIYTCVRPPPPMPPGTPEIRAWDPAADRAAQEAQRRAANSIGIGLLGPVFGGPAAGARLAGAPEETVGGLAEFGLGVASTVSIKGGGGGGRVAEPPPVRQMPSSRTPSSPPRSTETSKSASIPEPTQKPDANSSSSSKTASRGADGTVVAKKQKLVPGSAEHKADRWEKYQERGGTKEYDEWSKQYDTNINNQKFGAAREESYRIAMDADEATIKTPLTQRQIDIYKSEEMYAGQLKTGPVSLTSENALAIQKDAELVKQGWQVEHILEKGASKPYLEALDKAGIGYKIGPQIPR